jgi:hypothetical protein
MRPLGPKPLLSSNINDSVRLRRSRLVIRPAKAGVGRVIFDGVLANHRRLPAGEYQLTLVAQNANGKSAPVSSLFTLSK